MKHEEFLKQVKELAERTNGPTLLKLIAIIEKLKRQRNEYICANWEFEENDLNEIAEIKLRNKELDEIVGMG